MSTKYSCIDQLKCNLSLYRIDPVVENQSANVYGLHNELGEANVAGMIKYSQSRNAAAT